MWYATAFGYRFIHSPQVLVSVGNGLEPLALPRAVERDAGQARVERAVLVSFMTMTPFRQPWKLKVNDGANPRANPASGS